MTLDVVYLIMLMFAVFNGVRNGLIVAIFSLVAWILGLYLAFKFSDVAAEYLDDLFKLNPAILSVASFLLVFSLVVLIVNLGARLVEKTFQLVLLGWFNRFGGIVFYVLLYTLIFSVVVYFAEKSKLLSEETISSSKVYEWVRPIAVVIQQPFLQ